MKGPATARATGTSSRVDANAGRKASFDIDHGFDYGDPIVWLSLLRLYNEHGELLAQGPGFSNPLTRGAAWAARPGSTTTSSTRSRARRHVLPRGHELAALERPADRRRLRAAGAGREPPDGRLPVRAAAGARERERQQHDAAARSTQNDFFQFFDPNVGDTWPPLTGGTIDWMTPYARIQGSGDGSFDLYSFRSPRRWSTRPRSRRSSRSTAASPIRTARSSPTSSLRLNGRVTPGDVWTLGIRYRDYIYTAVAGDTLATVAQHLGAQLPARYTVDWTTTPGVLQDPGRARLQPHGPDGERDQPERERRGDRLADPEREDDGRRTTSRSRRATVTLGGTGGAGRDLDARDRRPRLRQADLRHARPAGLHDRPDADRVGARRPGHGRDRRTARRSRSRARRRSRSPSASPARARRGLRRFDGTPTQTQAPLIQWTTERITLPADGAAGREVGGLDQRRHARDRASSARRHRPDTRRRGARHGDRRRRASAAGTAR